MLGLTKLKRRIVGLKVPVTPGRYATEFYYARRFDWWLFILWPVFVVVEFCLGYYYAWHHKWGFIGSSVWVVIWCTQIGWGLAKRKYKK